VWNIPTAGRTRLETGSFFIVLLLVWVLLSIEMIGDQMQLQSRTDGKMLFGRPDNANAGFQPVSFAWNYDPEMRLAGQYALQVTRP